MPGNSPSDCSTIKITGIAASLDTTFAGHGFGLKNHFLLNSSYFLFIPPACEFRKQIDTGRDQRVSLAAGMNSAQSISPDQLSPFTEK
jgi:hypothetical protein